MDHDFDRDVAVVGAGRIGLPWATVLASNYDVSVTCIDIDETVVESINDAKAPFDEPGLDAHLSAAVGDGLLEATTDPSVVQDHRYVAFTMNAPRHQMHSFLEAVEGYSQYLTDDHLVVSRTTLPVDTISRMRNVVSSEASGQPMFAVFPERLAEGKAIEEIEMLPKVVGVSDDESEAVIRELLEPFQCPVLVTDPETAMFVKLIDNSYRDAMFAISNQIAYTAEELDLDAHEAIKLANHEYPRNQIKKPGTVGGKCLPKDPHFLTDETVCDQPTTPDLFNATRRTNAAAPNYIATELLRERPSNVAVLGLTYKPDVSDVMNSPAIQIKQILESHGVETTGFDPHASEGVDSLQNAVKGADIVLLAVNHTAFDGIESTLNNHMSEEAIVYDVWNCLDPSNLNCEYDGFGLDAE